MSYEYRIARPFSTWRTKPEPGEPSYGYFARLVAEEGESSVRAYANGIGLNGRDIVPVEILDAVLRLPLSDEHKRSLTKATPVLQDGLYHLGNEKVRQRQVSFEHRSFCPHCLDEGAFHRIWWDVCAFTVCPVHCVPLQDRWLDDQKISWQWPFFDMSPNGDKLALPYAKAVDEGQGEKYPFHCHVMERLSGNLVQGGCLTNYELWEVIEASEELGHWISSSLNDTGKSKSDPELGFGFLQRGREATVAEFKAWFLRHASVALRMSGFRACLPTLGRAFSTSDNRLLNLLHLWASEAFAQVGKLGRKRAKSKPPLRLERTLLEVAAELRLPPKGLSKLARHIGLCPDAKWNGDALSFDATAFDRLRSTVESLVPLRAIKEITGLMPHEFRFLEKEGLIKGHLGLPIDGLSGPKYLIEEIRALVLQAHEKCPKTAFANARSLLGYARDINVRPGLLVAKVLRGEITPQSFDASGWGFRALLFERPPSPDTDQGWDFPYSSKQQNEPPNGVSELWSQFRETMRNACPAFRIREEIADGGSIFTSTRKVALQVEKIGDLSFGLTFQLDPLIAQRRWGIYQTHFIEVNAFFDAAGWVRTTRGEGVLFVGKISAPADVVMSARLLRSLHRVFG